MKPQVVLGSAGDDEAEECQLYVWQLNLCYSYVKMMTYNLAIINFYCIYTSIVFGYITAMAFLFKGQILTSLKSLAKNAE